MYNIFILRNIRQIITPNVSLWKIFRFIMLYYSKKLVLKEDFSYLLVLKWIVFAKKPFGNTKSAVEYLGRYNHKIAISNQRIKSIDNESVTFDYKDYRMAGAKK